VRRLHVDLSPLRDSKEFRFLFASRTITLLGSQATEIALLIQVKELTGSTVAVGLLGIAELLPVVVFGLYGGILADRFDRRKIARAAEAGLCLVAVGLVVNSLRGDPKLWPIYAGAAVIVALVAAQRPSLDAAVPVLVRREQLTAASALMSLSSNTSFIVGAAAGGLIVTAWGPTYAYALDAMTFAVSAFLLLRIRRMTRGRATGGGRDAPGLSGLIEGLRYAISRPELVGSYLVDLAAMAFAFPVALLRSWLPSSMRLDLLA